jgi:hypothetical protein
MMNESRPFHKATGSHLSDWEAERQFFGRFYLSQGFTADRRFSNDCGPASLAVVINLLTFQANPGMLPVDVRTLIKASSFNFWDRLPGWIPKAGGATAPWGLVRAFNHWAGKNGLEWYAERRNHARRAHLLEALMMGKPVTALKIWKNGGAHWVDLVRFSSEKERIYFLDPNPYLENLPESKRLQSQPWLEFEEDWSRQSWWSRLLGIRNELIIYSRI